MTGEAQFTVVICTRDRPDSLLATLDALDAQAEGGFGVVVVDQSGHPDERLASRAAGESRLSVISDTGRGLSRARNVALGATSTEWLVFLDDDCVPEPAWAGALGDAMAAHPDADFVSGHVGPGLRRDEPRGPQYAVFPVQEEQTLAGRPVWPHDIGFGVCFAVRRATALRLGGWDERLGPGVPAFPASDDMDFNFRFLRSGGIAHLTPRARAAHEQWRSDGELVRLFGGYMASWAGFAVKHMKTTGLPAGLRLWSYGLRDALRMFASAARHRSRLRLRIARGKTAGLVRGTVQAWRVPWD
jgi:GT2 family glycosyltransferase